MGATSRQVLTMILAEAAMTTSLGGVGGILLGAALLFFFARSLIYYFDSLTVSFAWPSAVFLVTTSMSLLVFSVALGLVGAILPPGRLVAPSRLRLFRAEAVNVSLGAKGP